MNENCSRNPPSASDLDRWPSELGFQAVLMADPLRTVYSDYATANGCANSPPGGPGCSNAVTVIIDKHMRIRYFGRTYICGTGSGNQCGSPGVINDPTCQRAALDVMLQALSEP